MPRSAIVLLALLITAGCAVRAPEPVVPEDIGDKLLAPEALPRARGFDVDPNTVYYTRVGLWYEYGTHLTTNYRRGTFVPVNTPVKLRIVRATRAHDAFVLVRLTEGTSSFRIQNVEEYTKAPLAIIVYRSFATHPLALDRLDDETRSSVLSGRLAPGMTRFQTLLTRGYPPAHRTPDLLSPVWEYWRSRDQSHELHFSDGRVEEAQPTARLEDI